MTPEIQKVLRNLKTQRSPVVLDLCLRKTWSGKSHNYRRAIVLEKHRFQNVLRPNEFENPAFSNSSGLKSVFAKVWTVDLRNRRSKAAFSNFSGVVWRESGANHDVNEHHQTKGLMSKTKAVQVCSVNLRESER